MFQILIIPLLITVGVYWLFNPYLAHRWRTCGERWSTRERSHGHPFYWMMRYNPDWIKYHHLAYNRPYKAQCNVKNVMYVE